MVVDTIRQRTSDWISNWSVRLGELTKISTYESLAVFIENSISSGESIDKLTQHILDGHWRHERYQARRIALTEVLRAHSVAREEAIQQSPATETKEWVHTGSHKIKPRANHVAMNGQIVLKHKPFVMVGRDGNTYYPKAPLDPLLPAGEVINCHCTHRGIVNEDILGMSLEERRALQQQIIEEDDEKWKEELDRRNKDNAGIEGYEEEQKPGKNKETRIDRKAINSKEWREKFDKLDESKKVKRRIIAGAKKMLNHRNGTDFEDLMFIDSKTGKALVRDDYDVPHRVLPSKNMRSMVQNSEEYSIISIHNHPDSMLPSYKDLHSAATHKYKYGLIVGHNRVIYKYTIIGELNPPKIESALNIMQVEGYSERSDKELRDGGVKLEVL